MLIETAYLKGRKPEDLLKVLQAKRVNVVVDVRFGYKYPVYFFPTELSRFLQAHDILFLSRQTLGNPWILRQQAGTDFVKMKALYLQHLEQPSQQAAIGLLLEYMRSHPPDWIYCLICYCPTEDPNLCHRFWLREYILQRGQLDFNKNLGNTFGDDKNV